MPSPAQADRDSEHVGNPSWKSATVADSAGSSRRLATADRKLIEAIETTASRRQVELILGLRRNSERQSVNTWGRTWYARARAVVVRVPEAHPVNRVEHPCRRRHWNRDQWSPAARARPLDDFSGSRPGPSRLARGATGRHRRELCLATCPGLAVFAHRSRATIATFLSGSRPLRVDRGSRNSAWTGLRLGGSATTRGCRSFLGRGGLRLPRIPRRRSKADTPTLDPGEPSMTTTETATLWVYAAIIAIWPIRYVVISFVIRNLDIPRQVAAVQKARFRWSPPLSRRR